jgi:hypothetical protein
VIYLPSGTEMVHFPELAHTRLCIQRAVSRVHLDGFPHSEIPGSKPACGSPRLIAACHVLHRLLAPRHSPYALSSLIIKLTQSVFRFAGLAPASACNVLTAITAILPMHQTVPTVGNRRQGACSGLSTMLFRQAIDKFAFVFPQLCSTRAKLVIVHTMTSFPSLNGGGLSA